MSLRVRQILDNIDRRCLYKYIPKYVLPENKKGIFPNSINSILPKDESKSIIGLITEYLILYEGEINFDTIFIGLKKLDIYPTDEQFLKIKKSKTTREYLDKIVFTRNILYQYIEKDKSVILKEGELIYDSIQGHPDGIFKDVVIEIKTTSKLEIDIKYYMLQLLSYLALGRGKFKKAVLVLPLQKSIITFRLEDCKNIDKYLELLNEKSKSLLKQPDTEILINSALIIIQYNIGHHIKKENTFFNTVVKMKPGIPYQIFMGNSQSGKLSINESDIKDASNYVVKNLIKLYIHSPYVVNLSAKTDDDWNLVNIGKLLKYGYLLGAKGVVVHTGKHTKDSYERGVKNMRKALKLLIELSSIECPILLETPSGQGTETLCKMDEFLDFVDSFKSKKIGVCVDTCHVFANGHNPYEYIEKAYERGNLRLIHYNDSKEECGSCKDRHAEIGQGKIGIEMMLSIAEFCKSRNIDMLIE
jgi:deoxyribonuclease-4